MKCMCHIGTCITVVPPALLYFTHAPSDTRVPESRITLTHPLPNVGLHCWHFVMMSPSSPPFKVDTGVFIPQPDTPDTPISPYLSSPDEVTTGGGVVGDAGVIKPRLSTVTRHLPRPLLSHLSAVANPPLLLTRTFCREHVTHSLHLTPPCTFKWQQSAPTLLIFNVNQHDVRESSDQNANISRKR